MPNYILLEKITVGAAGASSVTFSGIPQTGYTDLVVKASVRSDKASAFADLTVKFNASTTSYTNRLIYGDGSTAGSYLNNYANQGYITTMNAASLTSSTFTSAEIYIPNYTSANNKSYSDDGVTENNGTDSYAVLNAGLWSNTAAITSIEVLTPSGNFVANSTFYLYGVAKLGTTPAIVPYATGGDTIMTDGTYWYHAFLSSGTFTPQKGLSCDVLTIAGGGGGRADVGGGGGAGGLLYSTSQSLTTTGYTVTIGAGGALSAGQGNSGSNSSFAALTATGGGGGNSVTGGAGGSGGGGGATGGTGTAGQGSNGGTGANSGFYGQGGGGGASAVGANGTILAGGAGGAGSNTYSTWLSATGTGVSGYLAGGGGGSGDFRATNTGSGAGGSGGGGAGSPNGSTAGVAGTANTGGGGGGGGYGAPAQNGGAGGSGLVIVRYLV
jgi:hypothetical protein